VDVEMAMFLHIVVQPGALQQCNHQLFFTYLTSATLLSEACTFVLSLTFLVSDLSFPVLLILAHLWSQSLTLGGYFGRFRLSLAHFFLNFSLHNEIPLGNLELVVCNHEHRLQQSQFAGII
jgi:hypothetical protein